MVQTAARAGAGPVANLVNQLVNRHDGNGDGRLSFREFLGQGISSDQDSKQGSATATTAKLNTATTRTPGPSSTIEMQAALLKLQGAAEKAPSAQQAAVVTNTVNAASPPQATQTLATKAVSAASTGSAGLAPLGQKPNTAQFMSATGTDFKTASSLLYGVIGSNTDLRDWAAIMSSADPVTAAREATGAMYNNPTLNYRPADATRPEDRPDTEVLARAGNFVYYKEKILNNVDNYVLALVDGDGYQLTSAANYTRVPTLAQNFHFDTAALKTMEEQLDAQGIPFRGGAWPNGFLS